MKGFLYDLWCRGSRILMATSKVLGHGTEAEEPAKKENYISTL